MKYTQEVREQKRITPNFVIKTAGTFFCARKPDSGLDILPEFIGTVSSVILNPTQFDIRRVSTSIASYSFRLLDKNGIVTGFVDGDANVFIGQDVEIWIGFTKIQDEQGNWIGEPMDFADYYKLPLTKTRACEFSDRSYNFRSSEGTDRMNRELFQAKTRLDVFIQSDTTTISCRDDLSAFPDAGFIKIENEFISYTAKDLVLKRFTGCIRGEFGSVPVTHDELSDVFFVQSVTANPIDLLLQLLTSGGGGGTYDVLDDGLGIAEGLIDIAGIEAIRDEFFADEQVSFKLYQMENALKFIEEQILAFENLRFTQSQNSKLTLAVLDQAKFVTTPEVIDESTIVGQPRWSVDSEKIVNVVDVNWDFNEVTGKYLQVSQYVDQPSIDKYGRRNSLKYSFQGIKESLGGQAIVDKFADRFLQRLSTPTPEIQLTTQLDRSLKNIGDKTILETSSIPAKGGTLNFSNEIEIASRAINYQTGDVTFKLQFTSFTLTRSAYIAPARLITAVTSQKQIGIAAGGGDYYEVGWRLRLWDETLQAYTADSFNEIADITGDVITFANDWTTVLTPGNFRLKFPDYDDASDSQKRYCFISDGGLDFADGKRAYQIIS